MVETLQIQVLLSDLLLRILVLVLFIGSIIIDSTVFISIDRCISLIFLVHDAK